MRFPWRSESSAEKLAQPRLSPDQSSCNVRKSSAIEIPVLSRFKRRREVDEQIEDARVNKRLRRSEPRPASGLTGASDDVDAVLAEEQLREEERSSAEAEVARERRHHFPDVVDQGALQREGPDQGTTQIPGMVHEASPWEMLIYLPSDSNALAPLQQTIESQFSLEILLKHQELRLIEEELAKCQIAYEQLRRCQLIPYSTMSPPTPTTQAYGQDIPPDTIMNNGRAPEAPVPDIMDGPYTRHYTKWLIPDLGFDGPKVEPGPSLTSVSTTKEIGEGRITRNHPIEYAPTGGKARLRGTASGSKPKAPLIPQPPPKEKSGLLTVRRSSDGQIVKLVCLDCGRGDFSSAQGFINHCRIAHHRGFESHDAAATVCGQPVELDESGNVVGDGDSSPGGLGWLVHPLVRSAPTTGRAANRPTLHNSHVPVSVLQEDMDTQASKNKPLGPVIGRPVGGSQARSKLNITLRDRDRPSTAFTPSTQTPRLSALLETTGSAINLNGMVTEANRRFDLTIYSSEEEEESEDMEVDDDEVQARPHQQRRPVSAHGINDEISDLNPVPSRAPAGLATVQARMSPAILSRPSSSKGRGNRGRRSGTATKGSTSTSAPVRSLPRQELVVKSSPSPNLSPTVVELTTAPSLISDDDEYEAHSESESPSSIAVDAEDDMLEFAVDDGSETTGQADSDLSAVSGAKVGMPRRTALRSSRRTNVGEELQTGSREPGTRARRNERHVTFAGSFTDNATRTRTRSGSGGQARPARAGTGRS